jgi:hypothetical protein
MAVIEEDHGAAALMALASMTAVPAKPKTVHHLTKFVDRHVPSSG